jgi:hypothetical protein
VQYLSRLSPHRRAFAWHADPDRLAVLYWESAARSPDPAWHRKPSRISKLWVRHDAWRFAQESATMTEGSRPGAQAGAILPGPCALILFGKESRARARLLPASPPRRQNPEVTTSSCR